MMKNLFSRVVAIALILATVEMALAGTIPKFQNPEGANQVSVKTGMANGGNAGIYTQGQGVCQEGRKLVTHEGLVIKPQNVKLAEQLAPAAKNGVSLPRDLGSSDPELNEAIRSYQNGQGRESPMTKQEVVAAQDCNELPYGKSLLHDFNDRVAELCNLTPDMRATCYLFAGLEHLGYLPKGTVLNVDGQHNVKFVCANGEEYVFDKDGKLIASGINEGTFNRSDPQKDPLGHTFNDMFAAVKALPQKSSMSKDEFCSFLEKYVEEHKITIPQRDDKSEEKFCRGEKSAFVADKVPDLSKLIDLFKQSVEYLRRINAMSNKPGEEYYAGYNKLVAKARAEIKVIENEIAQMNLTEAEKVELGNELGKQIREKVMPYCDMITSLMRQLEAKGYGRFEDSNFNFDPKYLK